MCTFTPHVCLHSMCRETFTFFISKVCRVTNKRLVVIYDFQPFLSLVTPYSPQHSKKSLSLHSDLSHWAEFSCRVI